MTNEFLVFGYGANEGSQLVIYEMGNLTGAEYQSRYQDGFDRFGGYSLGKFASLEEALDKYPDSKFAPLCREDGGHEYAENTCPQCGQVFCWSCCGGTNVHEGGKYEEDYMLCPGCGHNVK